MRILWLQDSSSMSAEDLADDLRNHGHAVHRLDVPADDFGAAVTMAQSAVDHEATQVIVGIGSGAAVAMHLETRTAPLVLVCPDGKTCGAVRQVPPGTLILHNRADPEVPWAEFRKWAKQSGARLIDLGTDHRQTNSPAGAVLAWACELVAAGQNLPDLDDDGDDAPATSTQQEFRYVCDACGEEIVVPLDLSEGDSQTFVEDCPVCCRANKIHVEIDPQSEIVVWAEPEQDRV